MPSIGRSWGEDMDMKLEIELVPNTVWFKSLYQLLPREVWNSIRAEHIRTTGAKCEICSSLVRPLQLHEIWEYDDEKHVQKLLGFQLLCRKCHWIKHIGLAGIKADKDELDYDELIEHFCGVNQCSRKDFDKHKHKAFEIWRERSTHEWKQDFGEYKRYIDKRQAKRTVKLNNRSVKLDRWIRRERKRA